MSSPTIAETYLALSLDCVSRETREKIAADPPAVAADATLLRYRLALCLGPTRPELTALREAHPLWIEAAFFEGRAAAASRRPDLRTAVDLLSLARPVLPESPAVVVALAHVQRGYGDLEPALARTTPPSRWCRLCAKRCSGARLPSPTSSGTRSRSTRPRA